MADEQISMFCAFTSGTPQQAQQYLALTDGNVEQAVELFFNSPDLGNTALAQPNRSAPTDPITIDDDEHDSDLQELGSRPAQSHLVEDDEAMARRLQEEIYGGSGAGGRGNAAQDEVRAPMARTTETLVGPGSDWRSDPDQMRVAVAEQMMGRQNRRAAPGIFNQRESPSIWSNDDPSDPERHRQMLSEATGGASDQSSKSNLLADLFRPPFDLISQVPFAIARDEGKQNEKWLLVNVQDPSIFDCQVLNRDIWKNKSIRETIKEHFIFLQYNKDDPRGEAYVNYYFSAMKDHEDAYPHIAIIDPRTGEQVKTWSGSPGPKPADMLMDLHEFLDRYSLRMDTKNPVQTKRKDKRKDVAAMSEDEMMQMAMQNSLSSNGNAAVLMEEDPDSLTGPPAGEKGKAAVVNVDLTDSNDDSVTPANDKTQATREPDTPFSRISSSIPHDEPTSSDPKETTRIQFRYSGGRIVRKFSLGDPVRRIYEWLKASPLQENGDSAFELISMGKNLIDMLDVPIGEAGLKQGTVMVEFVSND